MKQNKSTSTDLVESNSTKLRIVQNPSEKIHKFAFVVHPLTIGLIKAHFKAFRLFPDHMLEQIIAPAPPTKLSRIVGGISPTTGQRIEGLLITLSSTPRVIMNKSPAFTYKRLLKASKIAENYGAKIMGLGAFTSVVGDAGVTVAEKSNIAITTGNTLTVVATLESGRVALKKLNTKLRRAMIVGASGSIGSACSRMLASEGVEVVLVAPNKQKLTNLKDRILQETPNATVLIHTSPDVHARSCQLIITTTSAFGQRIIDLSTVRPGVVICDVARPTDISAKEASLRPDVLIVESGEVLIPGPVNINYDIGLPPHVVYACMAETALLAMDGKFESYSLGRSFELEKIRALRELYWKHGFQLAPLRNLANGEVVTDEMYAEIRHEARRYLRNPQDFKEHRLAVKIALKDIEPMSKGLSVNNGGAVKKFLALTKTVEKNDEDSLATESESSLDDWPEADIYSSNLYASTTSRARTGRRLRSLVESGRAI